MDSAMSVSDTDQTGSLTRLTLDPSHSSHMSHVFRFKWHMTSCSMGHNRESSCTRQMTSWAILEGYMSHRHVQTLFDHTRPPQLCLMGASLIVIKAMFQSNNLFREFIIQRYCMQRDRWKVWPGMTWAGWESLCDHGGLNVSHFVTNSLLPDW